jgi:ubiquinone/menaquinone biosynthesis C-methylase UbiE
MSQFDEKAATWDDDPRKVKMAQNIAQSIIQAIPLNSRMSAMELGCGTGLVTTHIAEKVKSVTAVDASTGMLGVLKQKIQALSIENITPIQADLTAQQPFDESFDFIYSCLTFHHIKEYQTLLEYFYTILNPGGMIAIADLDDEDGSFHSEGTHFEFTGFDRKTMKTTLSNIGFGNIQDATAFIIPRERGGIVREYPVFLITGRKN